MNCVKCKKPLETESVCHECHTIQPMELPPQPQEASHPAWNTEESHTYPPETGIAIERIVRYQKRMGISEAVTACIMPGGGTPVYMYMSAEEEKDDSK